MGKLIYGTSTTQFTFDDRLLAHLRVVIVTKLRRRESFTLTWDSKAEEGGGRVSLWLDATIPLQFHFDERAEAPINRKWIDALAAVAASTVGLVPLAEPTDS